MKYRNLIILSLLSSQTFAYEPLNEESRYQTAVIISGPLGYEPLAYRSSPSLDPAEICSQACWKQSPYVLGSLCAFGITGLAIWRVWLDSMG